MRTTMTFLVAIACAQALTAGSAHAQACIAVQECGDVNNSGGVTASDALTVLTRAVDLPVTLTCECQVGGDAIVSQPVKTGQTTCFDVAGASTPCAGSGQDGEFQAGSPRSFTDNFDGTVTDNATGLMWEKHGSDGSIHDATNTYTWTDAVAGKITELNSTSFAGHDDWRLPNLFELETLINLGANGPATYSAFNSDCAPSCSSQVCSCTQISTYWSSSTYLPNPDYAWYVNFSGGDIASLQKVSGNTARVRAVRNIP